MVVTSAQSRAARAWLGWSQDELARRANVSVNTLRNFENGQTFVHLNRVASIQRAIEDAGIKLLFDENGVAAGIVRSGVARVELAPDSGAGVRE